MNLDPKEPQVSPDFPDAFYRVSIKGAVVRDGKIMLVDDFADRFAIEKGGEWELPGGGLDFGEDMRQGLVREVKEEMGLKVTWVSESPIYTWTVRREGRRGLEWYWVLVVLFQIEVESLDFVPTDECRRITFMSKEELVAAKVKVADQLHPLTDLFNPADFKSRI